MKLALRLPLPLWLALAAVLCLPTAPASASPQVEAFEGLVHLRVSQGTMKQKVEYYVKGDRMRVEAEQGFAGMNSMIVNMEKKQIFVLLPAQKMFMAMPLPDIATAVENGPRPQPQNETRTILGYPARKYLFQDGDALYEVWATEELGRLEGLRLPGQGGGAQAALASGNFFPLHIIERRNGAVTGEVEVLQVQKRRLTDALFVLPPDYRKLELPFAFPR
jgi:hypothetical protein